MHFFFRYAVLRGSRLFSLALSAAGQAGGAHRYNTTHVWIAAELRGGALTSIKHRYGKLALFFKAQIPCTHRTQVRSLVLLVVVLVVLLLFIIHDFQGRHINAWSNTICMSYISFCRERGKKRRSV